MFKAIRDQFMWNDDFDQEWTFFYQGFLDFREMPSRWDQRLKEKRAYWREKDKRQKIPVSHAIFCALVEMADDVCREEKENPRLRSVWPRLADHLLFAASNMGHVPGTPLPIDRLPDRWRAFYEQFRADESAL